jgi:hypothetical protein
MTIDLTNKKLALVEKILANETYLPESGLVRRLHRVLFKLALADLQNLELVVGLKVAEAEARTGRLARMLDQTVAWEAAEAGKDKR